MGDLVNLSILKHKEEESTSDDLKTDLEKIMEKNEANKARIEYERQKYNKETLREFRIKEYD